MNKSLCLALFLLTGCEPTMMLDTVTASYINNTVMTNATIISNIPIEYNIPATVTINNLPFGAFCESYTNMFVCSSSEEASIVFSSNTTVNYGIKFTYDDVEYKLSEEVLLFVD